MDTTAPTHVPQERKLFFFSPQKNKKQKSAQIHHCTSICFWCVIRIIFGVFSLFCFGLLWNQWRQLPCCADLPLMKENLSQKSLFCLQTLWQHEIQLQPISHLSQLHQQEPLRKKTSSGAHFHVQIHTIRRMYGKAAKILRYAHACHWFFTQAHTHLCLCDGRGAFVLLREEEADGHEQLVNADSELFLILASCSERKEPTGLDDVLKNVLAGLRGKRKKKQKRICPLPPDGKKHKSSFQGKLSDNREFVHFVLMNFIQSLIILFISKSKVPDYSDKIASNSDNGFIILSFWVKHEEINWNKTNKSLWHCDLKGHLRLSSTHRC